MKERRNQRGIATLEATTAVTALITLLFPLIGVFDLLLARQQVDAISNVALVDNELKAFRMFSGVSNWYTRAVNGSDEGSQSTNRSPNTNRKDYKTREYHARLSKIADTVERQVQGIFGQDCVDGGGCEQRYRIEVRVVMPYIVHDTGRLIRITCGPHNLQEEVNGCSRGRVTDWKESQGGTSPGSHRFLRVRGTFLQNNEEFGRRYIDDLLAWIQQGNQEEAGVQLAPYAIPSGLFGVRHDQDYGGVEYQSQHGYNQETQPDHVRHIMFLGVRVYVNMAGTPGGFILSKVRQAKRGTIVGASHRLDAVLSTEVLAVPRQEF